LNQGVQRRARVLVNDLLLLLQSSMRTGGPPLLACLAVDGRKPKVAGQLVDLLSGVAKYLDAVLQEYGCTQVTCCCL
jgi:hypothetical protein